MKKGMKICAVSLATCMLMISGSNITERIVNCVYYTSQEYYDIICRSCGTVVAQEKGIGTPVHSVSHN